MSLAFIFPGQGSQSVGMGEAVWEAFPSARDVHAEVDDVLDQKLSAIMFNGPLEDLTLTANAQPALMTASVAVMRVLAHDFDLPVTTASYVAGHSLGEYSALCAAGALGLADTARLLKLRGEAMQQAVPVGDGAMAALLGASLQDADAICAQARDKAGAGAVVEIANDNAPGQVVISGTRAAVEAAVELSGDHGVKKAVLLPVSAPFHCSLMQPAADGMAEALGDTDIRKPEVALVNNVRAEALTDPKLIRTDLVRQVTGRVRWRESVQWMHARGVTATAEPGTGRVLTQMNRRIARDLSGAALSTPADIEAFAHSIHQELEN